MKGASILDKGKTEMISNELSQHGGKTVDTKAKWHLIWEALAYHSF